MGSVSSGHDVAQAGRSATLPGPRQFVVQPSAGRLQASQVGLIINEDDPYSVAVGAHYQQRRRLSPAQVLRVHLPVRPALTPEELQGLRQQVAEYFGPRIQALALAWRQPWAVGCNGITAALTLGYDARQCQNTCSAGRRSPYFGESTAMPFSTLGLRPSMLLAASSVEQARALIDRGVAADGTLLHPSDTGLRAVYAQTTDKARNVRAPLFPQSLRLSDVGLEVRSEKPDAAQRPRPEGERLVFFQTGVVSLPQLPSFHFVPGAVADHLTSFAGVLDGSAGQMSATAWIDAGATASYGTVSEPCNHLQKFPHPRLLLGRLVEGVTLLEAYWKSVQWPAQGVFIGEPLAAPYAPQEQAGSPPAQRPRWASPLPGGAH